VSSLAQTLRPGPGGAAESGNGAPARDAFHEIDEAEALGIPWREILSREILAESTLQRFLGSEIRDLPLWRLVSILPGTLLHCWRTRELVDRLCWEASAEGSSAARREVAALLDYLTGKRARRVREEALARHYWFAYNRVLELQALALAAEKAAGPPASRVAALCGNTGAPRRDAEWAVARLTSPARTHALDDAMARAREEGFEIPRAPTEPRAFFLLRRFVSRHRLFKTTPRRRTAHA
jgi:hypothetical protein